jgi:hypothetical protein|tara:strand:+ start:525 stop:938 length:414 start_codon:yes stop_codon:yes gene_type:complete
MAFLDISKKEAVASKPYSIEKSLQDWKDGALCVTKVKNTAREIANEGYNLSPDDLNKIRQLFAKISKLENTKNKMLGAVYNLRDILTRMREDDDYKEVTDIDNELALGINNFMSKDYNISKTCINKLFHLLHENKII